MTIKNEAITIGETIRHIHDLAGAYQYYDKTLSFDEARILSNLLNELEKYQSNNGELTKPDWIRRQIVAEAIQANSKLEECQEHIDKIYAMLDTVGMEEQEFEELSLNSRAMSYDFYGGAAYDIDAIRKAFSQRSLDRTHSKTSLTFNNGQEMRDYLKNGDLYNPELEIYVYQYNDAGALCTYHVGCEEAGKLANDCRKDNTYWEEKLGHGGNVLDDRIYGNPNIMYSSNESQRNLYLKPSIDFCDANYMKDGWVNAKDYEYDQELESDDLEMA